MLLWVRAVRFLQDDVGVPHLSLLTYRALLVVLVRFFAHFPDPGDRNRLLFRRFYWRAAISGSTVFKGSFTQMSRILCAVVKPGRVEDSVQGLTKSMESSVRTLPTARRFRTNEAVGKIIPCSWWALRPRSPLTGERLDAGDLSILLNDQPTAAIAVHRIYPRGVPKRQQFWAANRLFVPDAVESGDSFLESVTSPSFLVGEGVRAEVLRAYCLNDDMIDLFNGGRREDFLDARQGRIDVILSAFVNRMTEWSFEDTPPLDSLALDELDELTESDE